MTSDEHSTDQIDRLIGPHGRSYWQVVVLQFRKNRMAVAGLWLVYALFALAVLAPFLASDKPIAMRVDEKWSFPAIANLGRYDLLLLFVSGAFLVNLALGRFTQGRQTAETRQMRRNVRIGLALCLSVWFAADFAFRKTRLDTSDYKRIVAELSHPDLAIMPPIPHHYLRYDLSVEPNRTPSISDHILGTDDTGRDVASRLIHGTRVSLAVGFVSVGISVVIGVVIGAIGGYFGGLADAVVMRIIEITMCFPTFFLLLAILAFLPRNIFIIMAVLGLTSWTGAARLIRAEFLKHRSMDYVDAARGLGMGTGRIMFRHILPNAATPVVVTATFGIAGAILSESALTFLGFGVGSETPSWGEILSEGAADPLLRWHLVVLPGVAIFVNVLAYNLVGDGLRDAIDPRLRE